MPFKNLTIVGCGNLGSCLAYLSMYKLLDRQFNIKKINLIDFDVLLQSDRPYGISSSYINFDEYVNQPKVMYLAHILNQIQGHVSENDENRIIIDPIKDIFTSSSFDYMSETEKNETIFVDCRDTTDQNEIFDFKLASEGEFGKLITNPMTKVGNYVNYSIPKSRINAAIVVSKVLNYILNNNFNKNNKTNEQILLIDNRVMYT